MDNKVRADYRLITLKDNEKLLTELADKKPLSFEKAKGLKNIERVKISRQYKYYLGSTSSYSEIKKLHNLAISKGYKSSFVVAFKNGKKVSVTSVVKKS